MKKGKLIVLFLLLGCIGLTGCQPGVTEGSSTIGGGDSSTPVVTELNTDQTDKTRLTAEYAGKDFTVDGIGPATLSSCVDGDTTNFTVNSNKVTIRYNAINTPESTITIDPWGRKASKFVCEKLTTATEIVLENEVDIWGKVDNTGARYLGFVWYRPSAGAELRLLNLEIVEEAYSRNLNFQTGSKYFDAFKAAEDNASHSGRRVYGEKDDSFDYSNDVLEVSIQYIHDNWTTIASVDENPGTVKNLRVQALVVDMIGSHMVLRDTDPTELDEGGEVWGGIYAFTGYNSGLGSAVKQGDIVRFYCKAAEHNGTRQLTSIAVSFFGSQPFQVLEHDVAFEPFALDTAVELSNQTGQYVEAEVEVTRTYDATLHRDEDGNYTVYANIKGTSTYLNLRVSVDATPGYVPENLFVEGKTLKVRGILVAYYATYQILLGNNADGLSAVEIVTQ